MPTNTLNICFASDNNYAAYMGVALLSILKNAKEEDTLHFYIFDDKISNENRSKIESLKKVKPFEIEWIKISKEDLSGCALNYKNKLPITTYARFLIPKKIKEDKVLYLDCDIFVRRSLSDLFNTDIENYFMAGVKDYGIRASYILSRFEGEVSPSCYVNAGVLLINNKLWRQRSIADDFFAYAQDHSSHLRFADQDILNYLLSRRIKKIDPAYNVMDLLYDPIRYLGKPYQKQWRQAAENPYIRHSKPWKVNSLIEGRGEYLSLMAQSPWASKMPRDNFSFMFYLKRFFIYWLQHPVFFLTPRFYLRLRYRGVLRTVSPK